MSSGLSRQLPYSRSAGICRRGEHGTGCVELCSMLAVVALIAFGATRSMGELIGNRLNSRIIAALGGGSAGTMIIDDSCPGDGKGSNTGCGIGNSGSN